MAVFYKEGRGNKHNFGTRHVKVLCPRRSAYGVLFSTRAFDREHSSVRFVRRYTRNFEMSDPAPAPKSPKKKVAPKPKKPAAWGSVYKRNVPASSKAVDFLDRKVSHKFIPWVRQLYWR